MDEVIRQLLARDLADLEGLEVRGSVPIRTDLVNQLITAFLNDETETAEVSATSTGDSGDKSASKASKPSLPLPVLKKMVRRAAVRTEEGKIIFDFEIRR